MRFELVRRAFNSFSTQTIVTAISLVGVLGMSGCKNDQQNLASLALPNSDLQKIAALQGPDESQLPRIVAPTVVFWGTPVDISVQVPVGTTVARIQWDLGDGSVASNRPVIARYSYRQPGVYRIQARVTDSTGLAVDLVHDLNVMDFFEELSCITSVILTGPRVVYAGSPQTYDLSMPACLRAAVTKITWTLDGNPIATNQTNVSVTFPAPTTSSAIQLITIVLESPTYSSGDFMRLSRQVLVLQPLPTPTPEPTPIPDPLQCSQLGERREINGDTFEKEVACGLEGKRRDRMTNVEIQECQAQGASRRWTVVGTQERLVSEGTCEKQSCRLPNGDILKDGESRVLYTSALPSGSCSAVSESRTCQNGVLGGNSAATSLSCLSGCNGLGPHGSTRTVVSGNVRVPVSCAFGEVGIFDTFAELTDQACADGQVVSSNTRRGDLITKGVCPSYKWVPTDSWTECSANCGGRQSRIYACVDGNGSAVDASRCGSAAPVEARVCDGNPAAARVEIRSTVVEEVGSSQVCPRNQVGVVIQKREATYIDILACVDHRVQLAEKRVEYSDWRTEAYCRDYIAHRCSHDSLDQEESLGRYQWMRKCAPQVPVIAEFLKRFEGVRVSGRTFGGSGRSLYATFMNRATTPERLWRAPEHVDGDCNVPSTVYIAGVCVASCATPEQQILTYEGEMRDPSSRDPKYLPFLEAYNGNLKFVSTLRTADMKSTALHRTRVDQWVTELVDSTHDLREFVLESGRRLKVTPNHPIVTSEGTLKVAKDFGVGEHLVQLGGALDRIVEINEVKHFGKVYNVFVKSASLHHNIVVTNGYLNGTAYFQNEGAKDLNRYVLRNRLIQGVFRKAK